jgi:phage/plasmid-associated DNA primase
MFNDNHLYVAFRPFKFCKGYNESWIKETNKSQCVYFLVNNADGVNRKAEDIKSVNALFVDIDGTSKWNGSDGSVVVGRDETHWHCYWPLVEGEDMGKWKIAQKALIKHFGADPACSDLSRVMRVWGSVNRKPSAHGATYSVWKKEEKKWTIDEVVGFYGLDMSGSYNHDKIEISMEGVTCPTFVRDELKADIENKEVMEGYRYATARNWSAQALGAGMDSTEVHALATNALMRWGYDEDYAEQQATNAQSGTIAKIKSGDLKVDERLRPDLDFDDVEEEELTPEAVEAQEEELGCATLIKGLKTAEDKYDWLKENAKKVARLDAIEKGRLQDAWGTGVRVFNNAIKEAASSGEGENWEEVARDFLDKRHHPLIYVDAEWYTWTGTHYTLMDEIWVKKELSASISDPSMARVGNAFQQLQFAALKKMEREPEGVPFLNGRLMDNNVFVDHTPDNGGRYCLSFNYDPNAVCPIWEQSLGEWFNDKERPLILRQWMSYLLAKREDLHKIMLFTGLQRGGKGTIISTMQELIGDGNYSNPSMSNFASEFGLQSSVGKGAIFVSDAHLPARDRTLILERLKNMSGKDKMDVSRKNLTDLVGVSPGQIIIACNEMDDIKDESNALIDRYSIIQFTNSFLGKENTSLKKIIKSELAGIFNWARSCPPFETFHEDGKGVSLKEDMSLSANPVRSWSLEACSESGEISTSDLYHAYEIWCGDNGIKKVWDKNVFVRKLKSIFPKVVTVTVRENKKQVKMLRGLSLTGELPPEEGFGEF